MADPKFPWALAANIAIGRKNERRLTGRALLYWWALKGDLPFPRHSSLPRPEDPPMPLVGPPIDACTFVYCGSAVAEICRVPPEGRLASQCLPSPVWDKLRYTFETSATTMKPLTASGRFVIEGTNIALYRSIVLPLSEDGSSIDHLMGALNFKFSAL